ncbi:sensor domain-containing diguanylate cyclase [Geothrix sp. 21YS21S-4]|uniref:sensor domain-containing diguanylate cyclase n=1 Tax=Geothrix sp. 21YS21S-4 TaxID=3068889 RepID=UPI0027BAA8FF|nr:sensor domain-containing diguanylate cyclase [Geothrix sp. 21YS21S-4]
MSPVPFSSTTEGDDSLPPERLLSIIRFQTEIAKAGLDLGEVIERVAHLAQDLTEAAGAALELAEGEEMVYRAATGIAAKQLGLRIRRQGSLSGLCVEQGAPLSCEDSETDPRVDREACRSVGLRSMVVMPLTHGGIPVGVLKVLSERPNAFTPVERNTLRLISEVVAAAMANATLYTAQVEEARDLFARATQDSLTGLGNRALFYDRFHQGLKLARRQGRRLGIALIDMDGLKRINDSCGHQAGDTALRTLAQRLQALLRESDTLARLGGDEFAILLATVNDPEAARRFGVQLAERVRGDFAYEDQVFELAASIGVVVFPEDGADLEALLREADLAMYAMKRAHHAARD